MAVKQRKYFEHVGDLARVSSRLRIAMAESGFTVKSRIAPLNDLQREQGQRDRDVREMKARAYDAAEAQKKKEETAARQKERDA